MDGSAPPVIVGRYAIYGKIASGGMASVHFGRLIGGAGFSRTVAIKRLHPHLADDPDVLSTIVDEARLAARIHHPNVVAMLDVVATPNDTLLVMEYIRGESLSRLIKLEAARGRRLPLPISSAVLLGALQGLHAAHEATSDQGVALGIVHRDVSPQNILVGIDGLTRVIDFGIAKAAGRIQTTREGTVKGKMAYMAPEQLGGAEVTRATDVYAMGVVAWEALAGRRLFQADNDAALAVLVMGGAKSPPSAFAPEVPPLLDALVMRALSPAAAQRFPTARDMADALTRAVQPALSSDVGAWCAEVARESLEQRGHALAEIESSSGVAQLVAANAAGAALSGDDASTAASPTDATRVLRERPSAPSALRPEPPASSSRVLAPASSSSRLDPAPSSSRVLAPASSSSRLDPAPSSSRLDAPSTGRSGAVPLARTPIAERVSDRLAAYLGPNTARVAVKTFAQKALGRGPETLSVADLPALQAALRPMLRTFVGKTRTESLLEEIAKECGA
jgi:serine/threonine-protein kinase